MPRVLRLVSTALTAIESAMRVLKFSALCAANGVQRGALRLCCHQSLEFQRSARGWKGVQGCTAVLGDRLS
jgi:hypothetical protein